MNDLNKENKEYLRYLSILSNFIEKILSVKTTGKDNKTITQENVDKFRFVESEIKRIIDRI